MPEAQPASSASATHADAETRDRSGGRLMLAVPSGAGDRIALHPSGDRGVNRVGHAHLAAVNGDARGVPSRRHDIDAIVGSLVSIHRELGLAFFGRQYRLVVGTRG